MKRLAIFWLVSVAMIATGATANSDVLYSTFGPGHSYSINSWWGIGGFGPSYDQQIAARFTLPFDSIFDSINFAAAYDSGPNQLTVSIVHDDSGVPSTDPLMVIESFDFTNLAVVPTIYTADSLLNPLLEASMEYWAVLKTDDSASTLKWFWNYTSRYFYSDILGFAACNPALGTPWHYSSNYFLGATPAFEINGYAPVPEPATMLLLGSGMVGLLGYGRKKFLKK